MKKIVDLYVTSFNWIKQLRRRYHQPIFKSLDFLSPDFWCYLRMMLSIAIVFMYHQGYIVWTISLYIFALYTDMADGDHALATNQETEEGAKLDANADKLLIGVVLLFVGIGKINMLTMSVLLSIEGLLFFTANFLKPFLKPRGYPLKVGSNKLGKTKMAIQSIAVGLLLLTPYSLTILLVCEYILWLGILFGVGSLLLHLGRMEEYERDDQGKEIKSKPIEPVKSKVIINKPNLITLSAILLLVPGTVTLFHHQWIWSTAIFFWVFVSDWIDGWLARKNEQVTDFGTALDPIRDNIARVIIAIWLFIRLDYLAIQCMIAGLFTLELIIGLICAYMAKKYGTVKLVNRWGKARAVAYYMLVVIPYLQSIEVINLPEFWLIGIFAIMIIFSVFALFSYLSQRVETVVEETQKTKEKI